MRLSVWEFWNMSIKEFLLAFQGWRNEKDDFENLIRIHATALVNYNGFTSKAIQPKQLFRLRSDKMEESIHKPEELNEVLRKRNEIFRKLKRCQAR